MEQKLKKLFGTVYVLILCVCMCIPIYSLAEGHTKRSTESVSAWTALQRELTEGGLVILKRDYICSEKDDPLLIPAGVQVTLDLNGHTISGEPGLYQKPDLTIEVDLVTVSGELILQDTGSKKGGLREANIGIGINSTGILHMKGGLITNCGWSIAMNGGKADFSGGEIADNGLGIIYFTDENNNKNSYLKINGSLDIHDNTGADIALMVPESVITIDGKLDKTRKIAILLLSNQLQMGMNGIVTKGYSTYHTESPEEYFCSARPELTVGLTADGEVELREAAEFEDVLKSAYYSDAVQWAVKNNITSGTGKGKFSPDDTCTRGQIVTFLWRANGSPKMTGTANPFKDVSAGAFYYDAVLWAVKNGITSGTSADTFSPDAGCTRGQVVTFLYRSAKDQSVASQKNPFTDVPGGAYYTTPVLWAVQRSITAGITPTNFGPDDTCSRAQIVTFMYRYMEK